MSVSVNGHEFDPTDVAADHSVDSIISAAAYADDLNVHVTFIGIIMFKSHFNILPKFYVRIFIYRTQKHNTLCVTGKISPTYALYI